MLGIERIDHINMRVKNLDESIQFYQRLFGFELKEGKDADGAPWAIIGVSDVAYLCLYEHPDKEVSDEHLRISHFGFAISNFDQAMATLEEQGATVLYDGPIDWPHSRSIYIQDPNGHEIELSEKVGGGLN